MIRKLFLVFAFIGFANQGDTLAQWIIEQSPLKTNLNSISLINDNSGWIVGDKGAILYKVNKYWIDYKHDAPVEEDLNSIFMLDTDDGWIVGSKGLILHFDGRKWQRISSPTRHDLYSVSFSDSDHGIAVGGMGTILVYENKLWRVVNKQIMADLLTVTSGNDYSIIGGGLECVTVPIMKMINNNENTLENCIYNLISINSVARAGNNEIWAAGTRGALLHFTGERWMRISTDDLMPTLNHISFAAEDNGICVGYCGTILMYSGLDWTKQNTGIKINLNGSAITDNSYYAVGDSGTIISQKVVQNSQTSDLNASLDFRIEAYPNPCDEAINIIIPDEDNFSPRIITITNAFGQVILQKEIEPDSFGVSYSIATSSFNAGIYFIKAMTGDGKVALSKFIINH